MRRIAGTLAALGGAFLPAVALAQDATAAQSRAWFWWAVVLGVLVVAVTGALVAVGVRHLERQSRRESEGTRLQSTLTDPLRRDPRLAHLPVMPVVHVGLTGPVTVEVSGEVPSIELRDAVLREIERELARRRPGSHVVDHLRVAA